MSTWYLVLSYEDCFIHNQNSKLLKFPAPNSPCPRSPDRSPACAAQAPVCSSSSAESHPPSAYGRRNAPTVLESGDCSPPVRASSAYQAANEALIIRRLGQ